MTYKDFDNWRVFPRFLIILFGIVFYQTVNWFIGLDSPTAEQAAFASTMVGTSAAFFKFYLEKRTKKLDKEIE